MRVQIEPSRYRAPAIAGLCAGVCVAATWPEAAGVERRLAIASAWGGTGLLTASLLLMVREPHLAQRLGGIEQMYRWHHRSGTTAYALLLIHPLALAFDAGPDPHAAWAAITPADGGAPVALGWASLALLMAGLLSTFAVALRYRPWRALHSLLAVAVAVGLAHAFAVLGATGVLVTVAVVCVAALVARFVVGELGLDSYPYVVARVAHPSSGTVEATIRPLSVPIRVAAGQFVLTAFGRGPRYRGCDEFHPFTVSRVGRDGTLDLAIRALGACTDRLQALAPGTPLRLQGPFGDFIPEFLAAPQLWIAGGIGITPFMAALRAGPLPADSVLIYLYRRASDALFHDELTASAAVLPGFRLISVPAGDGTPDLGAVLSRVGGLAGREVRICGPRPMLDALLRELRLRGVPEASIHFERFDLR
ncbi:MAG: ferric reductase-like transmembrane domain-containing protein [Gammaproteobacteria bacterium]